MPGTASAVCRFAPFARGVIDGALRAAALIIVAVAAGCKSTPAHCNRCCVSGQVVARTDFSLGPSPGCGRIMLPNGASFADGLTEDEAVFIALWNNATFQELLVELQIARADLIQAGLLPNPEAAYFFPVSDKPYKYAIDFPIEALWLRPIRIAAAGRESARVCQRLTQAGLDLIRDVRQAYSDVLLARGRLQVAEEAIRVRGRIAELADARVRAGDASVQEMSAARVDALLARQEAVRASFEVSRALERLRNVMGVGTDRTELGLVEAPIPQRLELDAEILAAEATATRPDLLAAHQAVAAASERERLSHVNWVRLLGILDATSGTATGHELGPAFRVTLPVFNCNEGGIARAQAEMEVAVRQRETVRQQIILDVHDAHLRYRQAMAELDVIDRDVLPQVEAGLGRAEAAYRDGNLPYVVVLESTRQLLESHLRNEQLRADLRRAWAELERSVGRRLDSLPNAPGPIHELP